MEDYKFVTQKEYVDKLLKDNNPNKQAENRSLEESICYSRRATTRYSSL